MKSETAKRSSAEDVFERLHSDIVTLRLVPGAKLSEVEVARQNKVSRQPVREAFIRLSNMKLLQVRPQKATLVRKISVQEILNSRFIRTAIEAEVVRKACALAGDRDFKKIESNLKEQKNAANRKDRDRFHQLDYAFHFLLCAAAGVEFAYGAIEENKSQVDRLCMLELASKEGMMALYQDHADIFAALKRRDEEAILAATRHHLSRLDETLASARKAHPEFFDA